MRLIQGGTVPIRFGLSLVAKDGSPFRISLVRCDQSSRKVLPKPEAYRSRPSSQRSPGADNSSQGLQPQTDRSVQVPSQSPTDL